MKKLLEDLEKNVMGQPAEERKVKMKHHTCKNLSAEALHSQLTVSSTCLVLERDVGLKACELHHYYRLILVFILKVIQLFWNCFVQEQAAALFSRTVTSERASGHQTALQLRTELSAGHAGKSDSCLSSRHVTEGSRPLVAQSSRAECVSGVRESGGVMQTFRESEDTESSSVHQIRDR